MTAVKRKLYVLRQLSQNPRALERSPARDPDIVHQLQNQALEVTIMTTMMRTILIPPILNQSIQLLGLNQIFKM